MSTDESKIVRIIGGIVVLIILIGLLIIALPFSLVGAGERGVVFNNTSGVQDRVLSEGLHFRIPFVERIIQLNVRVQKDEIETEAGTKDLQVVKMRIVSNYHLDPSKVNVLYQKVGEDYESKVVVPAVQESIKAVTAKFNAEELLTQRPKVKDEIKEHLKGRLTDFNIILDDVSITDIGFSKEFDAAIEQKQVAEQEAKKAFFLAEKTKNEAEARINQARGEAEAQRLLAQSITPEVLRLKELEVQSKSIDKWNGALPGTILGQGVPFIFNQK